MSETIRCFLALEIAGDVRRSLEEIIGRLDLPHFHVRWVSPKNLHLTLRFLGEIPEQAVPGISRAAGEAAAQTRPFAICLKGLGAFPASGNPRVVWVGMEDDRAVLRLERLLTGALEAAGVPPPDRPFRPHLTLGRVKSGRGAAELKKHLERNRALEAGRMTVERMGLIRSRLRPSGPLYTVLEWYPFQGKAS